MCIWIFIFRLFYSAFCTFSGRHDSMMQGRTGNGAVKGTFDGQFEGVENSINSVRESGTLLQTSNDLGDGRSFIIWIEFLV